MHGPTSAAADLRLDLLKRWFVQGRSGADSMEYISLSMQQLAGKAASIGLYGEEKSAKMIKRSIDM